MRQNAFQSININGHYNHYTNYCTAHSGWLSKRNDNRSQEERAILQLHGTCHAKDRFGSRRRKG